MKKGRLPLAAAMACAALAGSSAHAATGFGLLPAALPFGLATGQPVHCAILAPAAGVSGQSPAGAVSKMAALLGGAPSQLDLIARQQGSVGTVRLAPQAPAAATGTRDLLACKTGAQLAAVRTPAVATTASPQVAVSVFARPTAPDEFLASRRLTVSRTAFDAQWSRISRSTLGGRSLQSLGILDDGKTLVGRLQAVNVWANTRIRYAEDQVLYGKADYWADPALTLRRGAGDCEDIAILKMQLLAAAGVPRTDMFLTIARDLARRADHAVLVVRDGTRFWLLDNATNALVDAAAAQDYRPIFSFSQNGKWLHGYAGTPAPQQVEDKPRPAPVLALIAR